HPQRQGRRDPGRRAHRPARERREGTPPQRSQRLRRARAQAAHAGGEGRAPRGHARDREPAALGERRPVAGTVVVAPLAEPRRPFRFRFRDLYGLTAYVAVILGALAAVPAHTWDRLGSKLFISIGVIGA